MASKRVQKDLDALNADLLNCETMVSKVLLSNKAAKSAKPVAQKSRPKSVALKDTNAPRDRSVAPMVTGPTKSRTSTATSQEESYPMTGQHYFHQELGGNTVVEVIVKSKSSSDTNRKRSSSATQIKPECQSSSENMEVPKQTNLNYNPKLQSRSSNPSNDIGTRDATTWDQILRQSMFQARSHLAPSKEPRRVIVSKSKTNAHQQSDGHQRSRYVGDLNHIDGRHSGASIASTGATSQGEGRYMDNQRPVTPASTLGHQTESSTNPGRSLQALQRIVPPTTDRQRKELSNTELLNVKITELNKKLEIYGLAQCNEMIPLMNEIKSMTAQLPPTVDTAGLLPINTSHILKPSLYDDCVPVRDADSDKPTSKKETSRKLHRAQNPHRIASSSPPKVNTSQSHSVRSPTKTKTISSVASSPPKSTTLSAISVDNTVQTISMLKIQLEIMTKKADDYSKSIRMLTQLSEELRDENKVIPTLRGMQAKLNERIELAMRENMKLSTDLQLVTNEKERLASQLCAKDVELSRLKEEITDIQHFVSDQLANLRPESAPQMRVDQLDGIMNSLLSRDQDTDVCEMFLEESVAKPVTSSPSSDVESHDICSSWQDISRISHLAAKIASNSPSFSGSLVPIVGNSSTESPADDSANHAFMELDAGNDTPDSVSPVVQQSAKHIADGFTNMMAEIRQQFVQDFKMPVLSEPLPNAPAAPHSSDTSFDIQMTTVGQNEFFNRIID